MLDGSLWQYKTDGMVRELCTNETALKRDHLTDTGVDLLMSRAGDAAHARHFFGVGIRQSSSAALAFHWYMGTVVVCRV